MNLPALLTAAFGLGIAVGAALVSRNPCRRGCCAIRSVGPDLAVSDRNPRGRPKRPDWFEDARSGTVLHPNPPGTDCGLPPRHTHLGDCLHPKEESCRSMTEWEKQKAERLRIFGLHTCNTPDWRDCWRQDLHPETHRMKYSEELLPPEDHGREVWKENVSGCVPPRHTPPAKPNPKAHNHQPNKQGIYGGTCEECE